MKYEIGTLFYNEVTNSVGEIITKDGNKWIAKFYHQNNNITYGIAPIEHVIIGKIKILEQLNDDIKCAEINLEKAKNTVHYASDYEKLRNKVSKIMQKNYCLMTEIVNIESNQIIQYSENRQKQIFCLLKGIKRNNKIVKRLNYALNINKDSIQLWEKELQKRKEFFEFVKRI